MGILQDKCEQQKENSIVQNRKRSIQKLKNVTCSERRVETRVVVIRHWYKVAELALRENFTTRSICGKDMGIHWLSHTAVSTNPD